MYISILSFLFKFNTSFPARFSRIKIGEVSLSLTVTVDLRIAPTRRRREKGKKVIGGETDTLTERRMKVGVKSFSCRLQEADRKKGTLDFKYFSDLLKAA